MKKNHLPSKTSIKNEFFFILGGNTFFVFIITAKFLLHSNVFLKLVNIFPPTADACFNLKVWPCPKSGLFFAHAQQQLLYYYYFLPWSNNSFSQKKAVISKKGKSFHFLVTVMNKKEKKRKRISDILLKEALCVAKLIPLMRFKVFLDIVSWCVQGLYRYFDTLYFNIACQNCG